jgi:hypothetical protein
VLTLEYGGTGAKFETAERNSRSALAAQLERLERVADGR